MGKAATYKNTSLATINIAVASDLHCHIASVDKCESYLLAASPRKPINQHPIQSLLGFIHDQKLTADLLVCPGDLTNRASREGLSAGFDYLREVKAELKCRYLVCGLGNHDVDSLNYSAHSPFAMAQETHPHFPIEGSAAANYWSEGFCIIEYKKSILLVNINTVADHTNEASAKRGTFSESRLERLDAMLGEHKNHPNSLRIALMHHHPILHSHPLYSSQDVLANGDRLLSVLGKHHIDLVIHGHRHQPRIRREIYSGNNMMVFAAGSFSAMLQQMNSTTRNLFHLLTLDTSIFPDRIAGTISSWEWHHGVGWSKCSEVSAGLPHICKFSSEIQHILPQELFDHFQSCQRTRIPIGDVYKAFPMLEYYMPDELQSLQSSLRHYGITISKDEYSMPVELGAMVGV